MLFHALNSASSGQQKDDEDGVSVISKLASQLAETVAECDLQLEEVLKIVDQIAQITKLIDLHWASALAIALRKVSLVPPKSLLVRSFYLLVEWKLCPPNQRSCCREGTNISTRG
jgi:hypothetical protein